MTSDNLIKETLQTSKIIAMVGTSVPKENEEVAKMRLKPSIIVMKYLLEFGYKVIPVNPFSVGKKVNGEKIVEKLEEKARSLGATYVALNARNVALDFYKSLGYIEIKPYESDIKIPHTRMEKILT